MKSVVKMFTGLLAMMFILAAVVSPALAADKKPVVGLVMKSLANEFFKTMEEGARKFAKEDGTFELIPVGMNSETDIDTQVSAMENFIAKKVDLIVVAPADSVGMVASVKKAIPNAAATSSAQTPSNTGMLIWLATRGRCFFSG